MADIIKPKSHRSRAPSGVVLISDSKNTKEAETFDRFAGTLGPEVIDIGKLYAKTGYFTYDPGFMATASCKSKITYIDGDKGVLLYRGYPIEELAAHSDFVEVCNLLLYGELPSKKQKDKFERDVTMHTMVHEQLTFFFRGFRRDAHPDSRSSPR